MTLFNVLSCRAVRLHRHDRTPRRCLARSHKSLDQALPVIGNPTELRADFPRVRAEGLARTRHGARIRQAIRRKIGWAQLRAKLPARGADLPYLHHVCTCPPGPARGASALSQNLCLRLRDRWSRLPHCGPRCGTSRSNPVPPTPPTVCVHNSGFDYPARPLQWYTATNPACGARSTARLGGGKYSSRYGTKPPD